MPSEKTLPVIKIQRFSTHDGPGVRTTVFLQGCPLRCAWCHNPESQSKQPVLSYMPALCIGCRACEKVCPNTAHTFLEDAHTLHRTSCQNCLSCVNVCPSGALEKSSFLMTIEDVFREVQKDAVFYGKTGGLTLSGGEPLIQENALTLLQKVKAAGISTAVETCGYFPKSRIEKAVRATDLFLWDIKETDETLHKRFTGGSNKPILENLYLADRMGARTVLRCIMIAGVNTRPDHIENLAKLYRSLQNCERIEIFSYRHHSEGKYLSLSRPYEGKREWIVAPSTLKKIAARLRALGVPCSIS